MHSDGTTKFHKQYHSFQLRNSEGKSVSFGLSPFGEQEVKDIIEALMIKLKDLAHAVAVDNAENRIKNVSQLSI